MVFEWRDAGKSVSVFCFCDSIDAPAWNICVHNPSGWFLNPRDVTRSSKSTVPKCISTFIGFGLTKWYSPVRPYHLYDFCDRWKFVWHSYGLTIKQHGVILLFAFRSGSFDTQRLRAIPNKTIRSPPERRYLTEESGGPGGGQNKSYLPRDLAR